MNLPLDLHPAVRDVIDDAHDWYEQGRPGLGGDFLDEVQRVLAKMPARVALPDLETDTAAGHAAFRLG
jgi:hypothetical protein